MSFNRVFHTTSYHFIHIMWMMILFFSIQLHAQSNDSNVVKKVTSKQTEFPDSIFKFNVLKPNPKRAGLYSACLPGIGQIYNKQYWKAGLIYAGGAVISGFVISNYREYNKYRKIYIGMIDSDPNTPNTFETYTVEDVKYLRDGFRKYLQYSVMSAAGGYILNILDAFISAHLKSFDMSKDISLHTSPYFNSQKQVGLKVTFCMN